MNVAVVGHLEWAKFVCINHVPVAGEIVQADDNWEEVTGGGAVAAMQLAKLNGKCLFFTSIGSDDIGEKALFQLRESGVEIYASKIANSATKSVFVDIDSNKERTITVIGSKVPTALDITLPWDKLANMDAVYFVSGDKSALKLARKAKTLVSTARILPLLQESHIQIDALVMSQKDKGEEYKEGDLLPKPTYVITTRGVDGGEVDTGVIYNSEVVPSNKLIDTYGCGDSFAAGLTYGLAQGFSIEDALSLGSHCGAEAVMRRGAFGERMD